MSPRSASLQPSAQEVRGLRACEKIRQALSGRSRPPSPRPRRCAGRPSIMGHPRKRGPRPGCWYGLGARPCGRGPRAARSAEQTGSGRIFSQALSERQARLAHAADLAQGSTLFASSSAPPAGDEPALLLYFEITVTYPATVRAPRPPRGRGRGGGGQDTGVPEPRTPHPAPLPPRGGGGGEKDS